MTPDDRYLCTVPKPGPGPDAGYLPFEGDPTLSVILSKLTDTGSPDGLTKRPVAHYGLRATPP
jgi:hypothetical protein